MGSIPTSKTGPAPDSVFIIWYYWSLAAFFLLEPDYFHSPAGWLKRTQKTAKTDPLLYSCLYRTIHFQYFFCKCFLGDCPFFIQVMLGASSCLVLFVNLIFVGVKAVFRSTCCISDPPSFPQSWEFPELPTSLPGSMESEHAILLVIGSRWVTRLQLGLTIKCWKAWWILISCLKAPSFLENDVTPGSEIQSDACLVTSICSRMQCYW